MLYSVHLVKGNAAGAEAQCLLKLGPSALLGKEVQALRNVVLWIGLCRFERKKKSVWCSVLDNCKLADKNKKKTEKQKQKGVI